MVADCNPGQLAFGLCDPRWLDVDGFQLDWVADTIENHVRLA